MPAKSPVAKTSDSQYGTEVMALLDKCRIEATVDDDNAMFGGLSIAEQILSAVGEEAIFAAANAGTTGGRDYVDRPFLLHEDNISLKESTRTDLKGGLRDPRDDKQYFLLLTVTDLETDSEKVLNTGSPSLVSTIIALRDGGNMAKYNDHGGMPLVITSKPASEGAVLILKKAVGYGKAPK
jgi:hypothetical protein